MSSEFLFLDVIDPMKQAAVDKLSNMFNLSTQPADL